MNELASNFAQSDHGRGDVDVDSQLLKPFDSAPIQGDQRQSYRYPAQAGREGATLRRGGKTVAAKLLEESAGGIALEVSKDVKLTALEQLEVGIYSGWYVARVIHVQPMEKANRVGLQRLIALSSDNGEVRSKRGSHRADAGGKLPLVIVGMAALIAGVALTAWFGEYLGPKSKSSPAKIVSTLDASSSGEKLKTVLDSVNILTQPEIAKRLNFTPEQTTTVEGVLVGASNRLSAAYEESKNAPPEVWYAKSQGIINDALENILCSMTDRQIVQWRRVLLEKRNAAAVESNASIESQHQSDSAG
jgi:hypothetical protein